MPEIRAKQGAELEQDNGLLFVKRRNIGAYMAGNGDHTVNITAVNTPVKIGMTTTAPQLFDFIMPENNRLQYIGDDPVLTNCAVALTLSAAGNNKVVNIYFAKNGQVVPASRMELRTAIGADERSATALFLCQFEKDDYMEIFVENTTDSTNITIHSMSVVSRG
jgi:hypothetical protein